MKIYFNTKDFNSAIREERFAIEQEDIVIIRLVMMILLPINIIIIYIGSFKIK